MLNFSESTNFLMNILKKSSSTYHAIDYMTQLLDEKNFKKINFEECKNLKVGDKFYFVKNDSAILAVSIGNNPLKKDGLTIIGSHSDSPALKLKPLPIIKKEGAYVLNTEVYGGAILHTWFDRPLSLAGRVSYLDDGVLKHSLVDFKKPLFIIPSLAIHMNRDINNGVAIEKQKTLLPIYKLDKGQLDISTDFDKLLITELNLNEYTCQILAHDLYLYEITEPLIIGIDEDFIQAPKLDNLTMAAASLEAFLSVPTHSGINVIFIADNEEVGSRTQQGANSLLLRQCLELIYEELGASKSLFLDILNEGLLVSADLAHAVHPNYSEKSDPNHRPYINAGPVIKIAANQSYASDSKSSARFMEACKKANVPYQIFVNHSDRPGGSTIGPISTAYLTMPTVDVGNAIWGMHSIREMGGTLDQTYMVSVFKTLLYKN